jgi:hypothetical protein
MNASETTDPGTRSGAMDAPSDEPSRSPDGQKIIAELRARATKEKQQAFDETVLGHKQGLDIVSNIAYGKEVACFKFLMWLDELSGCDTGPQREAGRRTT